MRIAVFGLGYVGSVSAACYCRLGHEVVGVDSNPLKVQMINEGQSPVIEPGLTESISEYVQAGSLRATASVRDAVRFADLSLICVGTPSLPSGQLDASHVLTVFGQIGEVLRKYHKYHVLALRSTLLPDTFTGTVLPEFMNQSGLTPGKSVGVCVFPEFLREGSAIKDFFDPPKIVIGEMDKKSGDLLEKLNADLQAPVFRCELAVACMVKYVDNSFHALKVNFANEIGRLCKELEIDSYKVMDIFCKDKKLNISTAYLKPGFAFGGSCLPKDVRALTYKAKHLDLELPMLENVVRSNEAHIQRLVNMLVSLSKKNLGFLGLSFKENTDDLRESPIVHVIESMIGKGYSIAIYDNNVKLANLMGANRAYIENEIPHISSLIRDSVKEVIEESEIIIVSQKSPEFSSIAHSLKDGQLLIDLVKAVKNPEAFDGRYECFC